MGKIINVSDAIKTMAEYLDVDDYGKNEYVFERMLNDIPEANPSASETAMEWITTDSRDINFCPVCRQCSARTNYCAHCGQKMLV